MASLTEWERDHLGSVHLLLEQATRAILNLEEKDKELRSGKNVDASGDWLKFRGIVYDLYSVLDYIYYLLYCHFSHKGQPDFSRKSTQFGFPSKPTGVKTSDSPEHDQRKKFVGEKLRSLWGELLGEETHFWSEIGEVILRVQPKLRVDHAGAQVDEGGPNISTNNEESFALLHFYRNCATHKGLIRFVPEKSWVEINQATREVRLVRECRKHDDYFYRELDKGYWLQLPETVKGRDSDPRLLLEVLHQLISFVKKISSKLLCSSLLLPTAKDLLCNHLQGYETETKFRPAKGMQFAEVTVTTKGGEKMTKLSAGKQNQVDAEEDACICLLQDLAEKSIYPDAPYSYFTPYHVQTCPPVQMLEKTPSKTYQMLLNEFKQRPELEHLKFETNYTTIPVPEKEQHYEASINLCIMRGEKKLLNLHVVSSKHEEVGKKAAKEAAAKEAVMEFTRLGLIQLKYNEQ